MASRSRQTGTEATGKSTSAKASAEPSFGLQLPARYTIVRHIATGGMASVWCAEDRVLGRHVAIKVLSERFAHDELAIRRFKREARAAARVSAHQHVVTIFDVGDIEPDGRGAAPSAFMVMEYLAGGTVADAVRDHAVRRDEALRWLREAASALDHAHERGIVHRDIKPANFLLDRERGLHVADFGIARLQSEDTITSSGELFGTAAYLAPEQALGRDATSASDRYSLAVTAFELLTGGRPFTASHFAAQARQHIEDQPPNASERDHTLAPATDGVLGRGMAKDPAARYPTAGAFVDALGAAVDGNQTAVTRPLRDGRTRVAGAAAGVAAGQPSQGTPAGRTAITSPLRAGSARNGNQRGRAVALIALAVVALGVILLISQLDSGSSSPPHAGLAPRARTAGRHSRPKAAKATSSGSSSTAASSSSTAASSSTAPPNAAALQQQGHDQLLAHDYSAAIPTLRRAVAAASPQSLAYAYALYDLGDALLLSGNPKAAIPILEQRLKIPNQTPVVQKTLNQALAAAGLAPTAPTAPPPPPGHHGHGHGQGPGKGD